ncbi:HAD family phosphatase [Xenophilus sp. Marseille-Q4582]|uniref:HAD family hydrolase n=1 Tax=Xenophilus sp. Marseille-Q4582 TaxID=2866600 RepID=UPI00210363B8|nr:HAD family phosphatase [Xenophilus sp. Marseille-Q4582]
MSAPHAPALPVQGLIFDMDGTMVDSMPWHAKSWVEFTRRHGIAMPAGEILRRTTGRTGAECMREVFERELSEAECLALVHEKEEIYRELFDARFAEVAGFTAFARLAAARGLKLAVGTAGDRHNIAFVMQRLKMDPAPQALVGGDEGFAGKPTPAIFLEAARRIGVAPERCIVFEDAPFGIEAARRGGMRAVAVCSTHSAEELAGPHVIAAVRDYHELIQSNFLETLDAALS